MRIRRHLSVPIVTTALALALAACGSSGTAQNVGLWTAAEVMSGGDFWWA
ncbi:hypothetical protein ACIHCQ_43695 [Streptomyces sp. NPDC052236]